MADGSTRCGQREKKGPRRRQRKPRLSGASEERMKGLESSTFCCPSGSLFLWMSPSQENFEAQRSHQGVTARV